MRDFKLSKEILKLFLLTGSMVVFFMLGYVVFRGKHYSPALIGMAGSAIGISLFQLKRIIGFVKNPKSYNREQVEVKDERNIVLLANSKASSYDLEVFIILGITIYSIYLNEVGLVLAILALWISRIGSFFYYLSKNSKQF